MLPSFYFFLFDPFLLFNYVISFEPWVRFKSFYWLHSIEMFGTTQPLSQKFWLNSI